MDPVGIWVGAFVAGMLGGAVGWAVSRAAARRPHEAQRDDSKRSNLQVVEPAPIGLSAGFGSGQTAGEVLSAIKLRLKSQQAIVGEAAEDDGVRARLQIRAEHDALWECVETLAQLEDGKALAEVTVRDYFGERRA